MFKIISTIGVTLGLFITLLLGVSQTDNSVKLGLSTFQVIQGGTGATTLTGCLTGNGTSAITGTGSACGSGSSSFAFPFTVNTNYNSTTTVIGFLGGLFSTASSTFSNSLFLSNLSSGQLLYTGTNGLVNNVATTTLTASSPLSLSQPVAKVGGTNSVLTIDTSGTWSGNAGTATALAANGTNCSTGFFPLGVDASGNSETCSSPFNWTVNAFSNSTTSVIGLHGGFYSNASSTIGSSLFLPSLSQGILYTGTNGRVGTVATSSFALSQFTNDLAALTALDTSLTFSGSYNGSVARTVGLNVGRTNTWTVLQNFNYSSSTIYSSFLNASSTNYLGGGLTTCTGSNFLQYTSTNFFSCAAAGGGSSQWATSTAPIDAIYNAAGGGGGYVGIGTTSPRWTLNVASTTRPQIALSGATTDNPWTLRSIGDTFALATASRLTFATSTVNALTIDSNNRFGIATNSPVAAFSTVGNVWNQTSYMHVGNALSPNPCNTITDALCVDFVGSDNTTGGAYVTVQNINSGTSAFTGYVLDNDLNSSATTNYAGTFLNSSTYNDTSFGTLNAVPNLFSIINAMGPISLQASSTVAATAYIEFAVDGFNTDNADGRIDQRGWGVGTSTPRWPLNVASTTRPQLALQGANTDSIWTMRSIGENFYMATASRTTFATTTGGAAFEIQGAAGTTVVGIGATSTPFCFLCVSGNGTTPLFALATSSNAGNIPVFMVDAIGHVMTSGKTPTVTACGTSPSITGNDNAGKIVTGTGGPTSCGYTFATTWGSAPSCSFTMGNAAASVTQGVIVASTSATVMSIMATSTSGFGPMTSWTIMYQCVGFQ